MKLNLEQIKSITFGAVKVFEENNGITFIRFTEKEQKFYENDKPEYLYKTYSSANIRLEFITNSKTIKIKGNFKKASSRCFAFIDIKENDEIIAHIGSKESNDIDFNGDVSLKDSNKHITIYLPWSAQTSFSLIELDDNSTIIPVEKDFDMLLYGDSITHGYDATYPSHSYAVYLEDELNANAISKAIGGDMFNEKLIDLAEELNPKYITVAYGTNDWDGIDIPNKVKDNMVAFFKKLTTKYPNATIFAITPIWRADYNKYRVTCNFLDFPKFFEENLKEFKNVIIINAFNFVPHDTSLYSDSYLHPNDNGFAYYSIKVTEEIKSHINK